MKPLGAQLPNIIATATAPENCNPICGDGSGTTAGNAITQYQPPRRPTLDEVPDILLKLRHIKPYTIKPDDRKGVQNALKILAWTTIPATYEEATFWISRLLAHYPRIEAAKGGVMLADLSAAIVEEGVSLVAVCAVCEETWRAATSENPWMPPTGELLKEMKDRTKSYLRQQERLANPMPALAPPKPVERVSPYGDRKWPDFTEADRERFWGEMRGMMPSLQKILRNIYDVPEDAKDPQGEEAQAADA